MVDSLVDTNIYFELPIELNITCNKDINQNGKLEEDSSKNNLISKIDAGDSPLGKLLTYNGHDQLLVYNETTKEMELLQTGDLFKINIDYIKGINYFIGAKKIIASRKDNLTFNAEVGIKNIFKVYLDGEEVSLYNHTETAITLIGVPDYMVDDFSKLIVILYEKNTITDNVEFVISYQNYKTIYKQDTFMNLKYFKASNFNGEILELIDSISPNQEIAKTDIRNSFKNSDYSILNKVTNSLEIVSYVGEDYFDLIDIIHADDFRMILINPFFKRCVIFNNCKIDKGVNLTYEKQFNGRKYSLDCGNRIEITIHEELGGYGNGFYGKGLYGANTLVINSAYLGGKMND